MIALRSSREISLIKDACKISAMALKVAGDSCKEGISTYEIDKKIKDFILSQNATPNFLNYNGFPASACISLNDTVIHGIPSKDIILKEGDIVSVDTGACYKGYNGDNAYTFKVGRVSSEAEKLLDITKKALDSAIEKAVVGNRIGDISHEIESVVSSGGYGIVREFVGHGIGEKLHEEPEIPNFGKSGHGPRLSEGMVLAIEPMINEKSDEVYIGSDGWTVRTKSGELSAHFEHTVIVTKQGPIVATKI